MNCARIIIFLAVAATAWADTWRVPEDVATIQAAFDTLSQGDTVIVAAQVYHESLYAPDSVAFVLLGIADPGGDPEKPVVDPSPLDGSRHLACLFLPAGSSAVIENFIFRNGPEMFPREGDNPVGGIFNYSHHLILRRCLFDSTYWSVYQEDGQLIIDGCDFRDNVGYCIRDRYPPGLATLNHSSFSGNGKLLWLSDSATVDSCTFDHPDGGDWIWLSGSGITVRLCQFGPTTDEAYAIIWTENSHGCVFENNKFADLELTGAAILFNGIDGDTSRFVGNEFRDINGQVLGATAGIFLQGENFIVAQNVFDSCSALGAEGCGAINLNGVEGAIVHANRIIGPNVNMPQVDAVISSDVVLRDCSFEHSSWALRANDPILAEFNWWGDSTGPYHGELNPDGLGDRITGPVDFIPWLTEDPFDSGEAAPERPPLIPAHVQLDVYPNPFNATAVLQLRVSTPGLYSVELYNTLGQRVKEVWSGALASEKSIAFNGESLPSGIYFVSLTSANDLGYGAIAKVVMLK